MSSNDISTFENYESSARSYCRSFPAVFKSAKDSHLFDAVGESYIDFFCGAGSLNYGHNNDKIKESVTKYLADDGILMSLDLHSTVKEEFISSFQNYILRPRGLDYRIQFTSPTGTSVVESAVKLARKTTGRQNVIAFTNAYHGMTETSLSLTGSSHHRQNTTAGCVTRLPFDGYLNQDFDYIAYYEQLLEDKSSGVDIPAAVILETVQGEGGLNIASIEWLKGLRSLTEKYDIPLIVDDIQAGCGRTGRFFSFERAGIKPDMVCLSKSIGGIGFPMAVLLIRPDLDVWGPGEDNGTFRGNNLAFAASAKMLNEYWKNNEFEESLKEKETRLNNAIVSIGKKHAPFIKEVRGIGLMQGIEFISEADTSAIIKRCFEKKLIIESCGSRGQVLKLMPALTIDKNVLERGIELITSVIDAHFNDKNLQQKSNTLEQHEKETAT